MNTDTTFISLLEEKINERVALKNVNRDHQDILRGIIYSIAIIVGFILSSSPIWVSAILPSILYKILQIIFFLPYMILLLFTSISFMFRLRRIRTSTDDEPVNITINSLSSSLNDAVGIICTSDKSMMVFEASFLWGFWLIDKYNIGIYFNFIIFVFIISCVLWFILYQTKDSIRSKIIANQQFFENLDNKSKKDYSRILMLKFIQKARFVSTGSLLDNGFDFLTIQEIDNILLNYIKNGNLKTIHTNKGYLYESTEAPSNINTTHLQID